MEFKKVNKDEEKIYGLFGWFLVSVMGGLIIAAGVITALRHFNFHHSNASLPNHPTNISRKYVDALQIALHFFDVQKSGKLVNNRIAWRGDSGLQDGKKQNLDLTKGMYDAGDLMKFGFPMAFTATVLSWSILEYGDRIKAANQSEYAYDSLRWITDYLINSHPSANVLYVQVGDPEIDHGCWMRPEGMIEGRPLTQVNTSFPGADVAAETAAAMASASLVFEKTDSGYSKSLLAHARQLFDFADTYRVRYSNSLPQVQKYYNSSGYGDELLWAAAWLYHATRDELYLRYATQMNGEAFGDWGSPSWFGWDDKHAGAQVLMSRINFLGGNEIPKTENLDIQLYRKTADMIMCGLLPESPTAISNRTKSGLIWVREWNPLQYAVASAFLATLYSDYMLTSHTETLYCDRESYGPHHLRQFAASQVDYVLGENPMNMSYLVGFGSSYPEYVHHRGSSIPVHADTGCKDGFEWLYAAGPNPNVAVGALVGGPFLNESFDGSRNNSMQGEPTTYNSALLVGLLSGLLATSSLPKSLA